MVKSCDYNFVNIYIYRKDVTDQIMSEIGIGPSYFNMTFRMLILDFVRIKNN